MHFEVLIICMRDIDMCVLRSGGNYSGGYVFLGMLFMYFIVVVVDEY